jgi:D-glycero-D-manno-heptose 1,7-bisphosphate phosphatase
MQSLDGYQAWFFDLGGTLVQIERDEVAVTAQGRVIPIPGAIEAIARLRDERMFIISNQAAVAQGSLAAMQAYDFIRQINTLCGGAVTDTRFAMHPPEANHPWRKPAPGMLQDLATVYGLELSRCAMVGDSQSDESCARNAGIGAFFWIDDFLSRSTG